MLSLLFALMLGAHGSDCKDPLKYDFRRQWGVQLLPNDDIAFTDPEYLQTLVSLAGVQTVSFHSRQTPYHTPATPLFDKYENLLQRTVPQEDISILRFSNTGTEANNFLYEMAEHAYQVRTGHAARRVNILYLGAPFGGTFGRIAQIARVYNGEVDYRTRFGIEAPWATQFRLHKRKEAKRLRGLEDAALAQIRQRVADPELEIGGIFLEPIAFHEGVHVYRPSFLAHLRKLADELHVPIFADEILTGGGRTGKFWAFQHYPGFVPDLFTFGKGLVAQGLVQVERRVDYNLIWRWPRFSAWYTRWNIHPQRTFDNTSRIHPLVLLQGIQVVQRILTDHLDRRAGEVGEFALEQLRAKAKRVGFDASQVNGIGLLLFVGEEDLPTSLIGKTQILSYHGRWMPPLTTTKEDISRIFESPI